MGLTLTVVDLHRLFFRRLVFLFTTGQEYSSYGRLHKRTMVELVSDHLSRAPLPL
jgi:hypothetical protein